MELFNTIKIAESINFSRICRFLLELHFCGHLLYIGKFSKKCFYNYGWGNYQWMRYDSAFFMHVWTSF